MYKELVRNPHVLSQVMMSYEIMGRDMGDRGYTLVLCHKLASCSCSKIEPVGPSKKAATRSVRVKAYNSHTEDSGCARPPESSDF